MAALPTASSGAAVVADLFSVVEGKRKSTGHGVLTVRVLEPDFLHFFEHKSSAFVHVGNKVWGLTRGCLRTSPGGRPHAVAASCGRPPVDARHRLCAGFRQCGSFVEVCPVD
jgi:hypothetical protein